MDTSWYSSSRPRRQSIVFPGKTDVRRIVVGERKVKATLIVGCSAMLLTPDHKIRPRVPKSAEPLFEFHVPATHTFWRVEIRDHGETYGVEAMFFDPVDLRIARTFQNSVRNGDP